ncbi:MAG: hypothetical protein ABR548_06220 [Actinomycetota bacterium]|nr:hypothetical protein [Actinomycetota bacterium]
MRYVLAAFIGLFIAAIGFGTLRGLARPRSAIKPEEAVPVLKTGARITFYCETCGTELLLLRKGTDNPPRHCGEPMLKREEVAQA